MSRSYKHLTQEQRYEIRAMYLQGISYRRMSSILGLSPSTISREIRRNSGFRGYRPKQAQQKADERRKRKGKALKFRGAIKQRVCSLLQEDWSPQQISLHLSKENMRISHECIYRHIWIDKSVGGILWQHLRRSRKRYRKRSSGKDLRGQIVNRRS